MLVEMVVDTRRVRSIRTPYRININITQIECSYIPCIEYIVVVLPVRSTTCVPATRQAVSLLCSQLPIVAVLRSRVCTAQTVTRTSAEPLCMQTGLSKCLNINQYSALQTILITTDCCMANWHSDLKVEADSTQYSVLRTGFSLWQCSECISNRWNEEMVNFTA